MADGQVLSRTLTFFEEKWHEGNVPIMGPRTHAAWLCSLVFDGARAFEGVTPDLDLHCARVNDSAKKLYLKPVVSTETWVNFKLFGAFGLMLLFIVLQGAWLHKHIEQKEES